MAQALRPSEDAAFLAGEGELGALMREHNWPASPLGPPATWPQPLKTLVGVMLTAKQAMFLAWGPQRTLLYNDAYAEILAAKHPAALGRDFLDVWHEIRADLLPIVQEAYAGRPVHMDDIELRMERKGYPEETHFAFSYTPVRDETGEVQGFFCPCIEITEQVFAQRRTASERERLARMFEQAPGFITILKGPEHVFDFVNASYRRLFGDRDYIGKTAREVFPDLVDQGFFDLLDQVFTTGEPFVARHVRIRLERSPGEPPQELVLDFIYEPVLDEGGQVTGIFCEGHDVTKTHRADAALRAHAARQGFRLELVERLRGLNEPTAIMNAALALLGEHLGLDRAGYTEIIDDAIVRMTCSYTTNGMAPLTGDLPLASFGEARIARQQQGIIETSDDVLLDREQDSDIWAAIQTRSMVSVPLVREGRLIASLYVNNREPRRWTAEEVAFIEEVATRTWDAVERARAELALAESEARVRALTDNLPAGMVYQIATGPDGNERRFLYVSQSHEKLTGVPADAVLADPTLPYKLILPEDRERLAATEVQALREMRPFDVEARFRRIDGEVRWCRIISAPRKQADGSLIWDGIQIDVTEQKETEARLRELNETLEQRVAERTRELERVWHNSQDLQFVVDAEGVLKAVSPAATRLLGWLPEEMVGRPLFDFTHPDGHIGSPEKLAGALAGPTETHLNRYRDTAGNYHWISWITTPADGLIYCYGRDVTAEVQRQAELEAAQEQLRQSQKMEAMGQLTGGVAHDFNNLLTPIIASLDMLLRRGLGSERERRLMDGALQSAERAKTLVQRLLAFARRQPLQPGPVDVRQLVGNMAGLISSTSGPKIDVRVELHDDLPPALADANQLEMAVLNLAVNARDAMPDAGVLTISAERESVRGPHPAKLRPGHYVRLSVKDTGVGMDEATVARAVEPFFSTKGIGKGTGLGLSMVHGLASQLGGGLTITSHPGQGTTVDLWLPISAVAAEEGQAVQATTAPKGQGTALLVDDEDLVRMSTADMLMDLGYEVVEATSAEEALRLMGEGLAPDLVVTDHLMPGLSGLDLARDLRARRPELPVLIVSGYAEMDGIAPGFLRLSKPFRSTELAERLAALMPVRAD